MKWLHPEAFWLFSLAVPLAVLFLYRHRSVVFTVPSIQFWLALGQPKSVNRFGKNLANVRSLLAALAVLALLVFALAGPYHLLEGKGELIVVVDGQATMQTQDVDGGSRLDAAKVEAAAAVEKSASDTIFTLVKAGLMPEVVVARCADRTTVCAAIDGLRADDTDSDLMGAIELADSLRTVGRTTRVLVYSDCVGQIAATDEGWPAGVDLRVVGGESPNIGIGTMAGMVPEGKLRVMLYGRGVENRKYTVRLSRVTGDGERGRMISEAVVGLIGERAAADLDAELPPGAPFRVDVEPGDALAVDNVAWGVWPGKQIARGVLVTRGNPFLEAALSADPSVELRVISPYEWRPGKEDDLTVFDGSAPGDEKAEAGRYLFFGGADPFGWVEASEEKAEGEITPTNWVADHPMLQDADLSSWRVAETAGLAAPEDSRSIVAANRTELVFEIEREVAGGEQAGDNRPTATAVFFNFELADSDLVLKPTFPVLLWQTVGYLLGRSETDLFVAQRTGTTIYRPRDGAEDISITLPDGSRETMVPGGHRWLWSDTSDQGLYCVHSESGNEYVAMNGMSARFAETPQQRFASVADREVEASGSWWDRFSSSFTQPWHWLLLVLPIVILLEWILYQRRVLRV